MARIISSYYQDPNEDEEESIAAVLADEGHLPAPPQPDSVVEELALAEPTPPTSAPEEDHIDVLASAETAQPTAARPEEDHIDILAKDPEPKDAGPVTSAAEQREYEARPWGAHDEPANDNDDDSPGVSGWAIAADLIFNRGQGLGQIVGMAEKQKQEWARDKSRYRGSAAQQEIARRQIEVQERQNYLREHEGEVKHGEKLTDQELRGRGVGVQEGNLDLRENIHSDRSNPESGLSKTVVEVAKRKAGGAAQAKIDTTHENIETIASDAATKSAAQAVATNPSKLELKKAETPGSLETARHNAVTEKLAGEGAARAATKDERAEAKDERDNAAKIVKDAGDEFGLLSGLDTVLGAHEKWKGKGHGIPGIGEIESGMGPVGRNVASKVRGAFGGATGMSKEDLASYNTDAEAVGGAIASLKKYSLHDISGASAAEKEFQRIAGEIATGGMSEEQTVIQLRRAKKLYEGVMAARSTGNEKVTGKVLERAGLDPSIVAPRGPAVAVEPPATELPPPPPRGAPGEPLPPGPRVTGRAAPLTPEEIERMKKQYSRWAVP